MKEITKWLGITVFEMLVWLVSVVVSCVLSLLRIEWGFLSSWSWWHILAPIFFADLLNAYFCVIVFIRAYLSGVLKPAALRLLWSAVVLALGFVFKFLLCKKVEAHAAGVRMSSAGGMSAGGLDFSAVLAPVFILDLLVIMRACNYMN